MDGVDGARRRRRSLKERLGLKGMGCCGTTWVFGGTNVRDDNNNNNNIVVDDDDEEEDVVVIDVGLGQAPPGQNPDPLCVSPVTSGSGMNLAAALAAERHLRASHEPERVATVGPTDTVVGTTTTAPGTPFRVSLMRLLEETDGGDEEEKETTMMTEKEKGGVEGNDSVCCVCMVRKKGAAFIPCGHTFCRVCSRELWLNRGSCPLCNRSILEILDIF